MGEGKQYNIGHTKVCKDMNHSIHCESGPEGTLVEVEVWEGKVEQSRDVREGMGEVHQCMHVERENKK